jgi:hypothetical protein
MGATTAITVAVVGLVLERLPFPANYQIAFVGFSIAGLVSYHYSHRFRVLDAGPVRDEQSVAGSTGHAR